MAKLKRFIYGGDYNPNQWDKEIWKEDMRIFKSASINSATINVFSWAKIQPDENTYCFDELDEVIDMLSKEQYDIVLATSTAALPAWMFKKYPEVGRVDFQGRRHTFGQRHNACPNSLVYQKFSYALVRKLAERYGSNPYITVWHVNNEYGGECYCEKCEEAFRVWLKRKYQTIEKVNEAWNLEFWGHTVYDWDEIVLPTVLGDAMDERRTAFSGLSIDYRRFNSDSMLENFKLEKKAIREFDKNTLITTNFMGAYKPIDYFKWSKELDVVSWDNYPNYNTPWSYVAMNHDLMRSLKNQPFMLMEQTPSQQNWQPYNSLKKPGQLRAQSYQTIAHGADTIQYFQLRRSIGGCEKFHGAVIEHVGTTNTRVFKEVAKLGLELKEFGEEIVGADTISKVGIIFDWDNYWALEYTSGPNQDLFYVDQIHQYYQYFYKRNISVDFIPMDGDFSKYACIVAPVLYMTKGDVVKRLETFVKDGGTFVTTFMSGIVGDSDNVHLGGYPGPLRELTGVWVEEIDALAPEQVNHIEFNDGTKGTTSLLSDLIHVESATCLGNYTSNFYEDMPFASENTYGEGHCYYIGTQLDSSSLSKLMDMITQQPSIHALLDETTELEIRCRYKGSDVYYFIMNLTKEAHLLPRSFRGCVNVLDQQGMSEHTLLQPYDVVIVKNQKK